MKPIDSECPLQVRIHCSLNVVHDVHVHVCDVQPVEASVIEIDSGDQSNLSKQSTCLALAIAANVFLL